jgi:hypothetical protein
MSRILSNINREVSIAPLVTFRALFGLAMLISIVRFTAKGWIDQLYLKPGFFFTYPGFGWVQPFDAPLMYALFVCMAIGAAGIMLGWRYRLTSVLFFLTFTYVELIDKTNYLNHYYFVSIIAFLLTLVPAHRYFSLDARKQPENALATVPAWMVNIFKLQLGMVYLFAGIAKINPDWLLKAMPLKIWLAGKSNIPVIGGLFNHKWAAHIFSWCGMLYDLCIPFLLLSKRWRPLAYLAVIVFHVLTAILFNIGMFPLIMILSTLIFFPDSFHDKLIATFHRCFRRSTHTTSVSSYRSPVLSSISSHIIPVVLVAHFTVQAFLPFRYAFYPGDLFWTEQGYRFSWRVMLMEKAGTTQFVIKDSHGKFEAVDNLEFLTPYQDKMMSTQPDMIVQFAHHLANEYTARGFDNPKVQVNAQVALNGRRSTALIDPEVNLAEVRYRPGKNSWIIDKQK